MNKFIRQGEGMKNALIEGARNQTKPARPQPAPLGFNTIKNRSRFREPLKDAAALLLRQSNAGNFFGKQTSLNRLLENLPASSLARLTPDLEQVSLAAGENLYKPGERMRFVYFPQTAVVSHLYMLADGNTSEVAMVGSEGIAGLNAVFNSERQQFWTEVTIPGEALRIKTEILNEEFSVDPFLRALVLDYANAHISQISQRTVCNTHHVAESRLCSWLLMLHDRVKSNRLPLTQDKIARYLGVNRPSITHIAQLLREKGLIDYTRGFISILDRRCLADSACECYEMNQEMHAVGALQ